MNDRREPSERRRWMTELRVNHEHPRYTANLVWLTWFRFLLHSSPRHLSVSFRVPRSLRSLRSTQDDGMRWRMTEWRVSEGNGREWGRHDQRTPILKIIEKYWKSLKYWGFFGLPSLPVMFRRLSFHSRRRPLPATEGEVREGTVPEKGRRRLSRRFPPCVHFVPFVVTGSTASRHFVCRSYLAPSSFLGRSRMSGEGSDRRYDRATSEVNDRETERGGYKWRKWENPPRSPYAASPLLTLISSPWGGRSPARRPRVATSRQEEMIGEERRKRDKGRHEEARLIHSQSTHHSSVSFGHAHRRRRRREVGEPNGTGDEWSEWMRWTSVPFVPFPVTRLVGRSPAGGVTRRETDERGKEPSNSRSSPSFLPPVPSPPRRGRAEPGWNGRRYGRGKSGVAWLTRVLRLVTYSSLFLHSSFRSLGSFVTSFRHTSGVSETSGVADETSKRHEWVRREVTRGREGECWARLFSSLTRGPTFPSLPHSSPLSSPSVPPSVRVEWGDERNEKPNGEEGERRFQGWNYCQRFHLYSVPIFFTLRIIS